MPIDERYRELLAGYVDDELTPDQREEFERELQRNPELQSELDEFSKLREVTDQVTYADIPDHVWAGYWSSIYRRLERSSGWLLLSAGLIILLGFGLYTIFSELFTDPTVPVWLKIGVGAVFLGSVILLVSYARERLFAWRRDRYREVIR